MTEGNCPFWCSKGAEVKGVQNDSPHTPPIPCFSAAFGCILCRSHTGTRGVLLERCSIRVLGRGSSVFSPRRTSCHMLSPFGPCSEALLEGLLEYPRPLCCMATCLIFQGAIPFAEPQAFLGTPKKPQCFLNVLSRCGMVLVIASRT